MKLRITMDSPQDEITVNGADMVFVNGFEISFTDSGLLVRCTMLEKDVCIAPNPHEKSLLIAKMDYVGKQ